MGLRDIDLKEEYRSDRDNLVTEFFIPCLDSCIEYDRAVEFIAVKSLTSVYLGLRNFIDNDPKIRFVSGHRFHTSGPGSQKLFYKFVWRSSHSFHSLSAPSWVR